MSHRVGWLRVTLVPRAAAAPAGPLVSRPQAAAAGRRASRLLCSWPRAPKTRGRKGASRKAIARPRWDTDKIKVKGRTPAAEPEAGQRGHSQLTDDV